VTIASGSGGWRECRASLREVAQHFLKPFAHPGDESAIGVKDKQTELPPVEEAHDATVGMEGYGGNGPEAHLLGGVADLGEHRHRLAAKSLKVGIGRGLGSADHPVAVGQDAGVQTWKLSCLGNNPLERELLVGHEEGLQRRAVGQLIMRVNLPKPLQRGCDRNEFLGRRESRRQLDRLGVIG
jgi:hypothetical protein